MPLAPGFHSCQNHFSWTVPNLPILIAPIAIKPLTASSFFSYIIKLIIKCFTILGHYSIIYKIMNLRSIPTTAHHLHPKASKTL